MNFSALFLALTATSHPYLTEHLLMPFLPEDVITDGFGNYFYAIGKGATTAFTCHLDNACQELQTVNHQIDGNMIRTDGTTILGADDKAGLVVLLYLIQQRVPGLYCFFIGEERGCLGSVWSRTHEPERYAGIRRMISFDRKGTGAIITHQYNGSCCSEAFAAALGAQYSQVSNGVLHLGADPNGHRTDSAEFITLIPECTNVSVGYYNAHQTTECQDLAFLAQIAQASALVDWEALPVAREVNPNG